MINKIELVFVILFLCVIGCNNKNIKKEITPNVTSKVFFMDLIDNLPSLELPYTMYCGLNESFPWIDDLDKRLVEYLPENVIVAGKLPVNNDFVYIIYGEIGDIIYPYLNIYNQNGEKLDSIYLHISWCAADEWERTSTTTTINKDFSISMTDTSQYIHYLDAETYITDSIVVKRKVMQLMNSGLYQNVSFDSLKIQ